jgi:hypothetical protein
MTALPSWRGCCSLDQERVAGVAPCPQRRRDAAANEEPRLGVAPRQGSGLGTRKEAFPPTKRLDTFWRSGEQARFGAQVSKLASAITIPEYKAASKENNTRSLRIGGIASSPRVFASLRRAPELLHLHENTVRLVPDIGTMKFCNCAHSKPQVTSSGQHP